MAACSYESRLKFYRISAAVLCVVLVLIQGLVLDYYLATHKGKAWWAFAAADAVNFIVFTAAFVVSFVYFERKEKGDVDTKGRTELPLGYTAWLCYSLLLVPRVGIIFEDFAANLKEEDFFGPNTLKTMIALSCIIFLLLVATHHDAPHVSKRHSFIVAISHGVTFNILDTVAILELLFIEESHMTLTFELHRVINAFACLNLILPVVPLLVLSHTRYGKESMTKLMRTIHTLLNLLVINLPLFIIRMYLWHALSKNISVFLIKNSLGICFTIKDLWDDWLGPKDTVDGPKNFAIVEQDGDEDDGKDKVHEMLELKPRSNDETVHEDTVNESVGEKSRYQFV